MMDIAADARFGHDKLGRGGLIILLSGAFLSVMSAISVNVAIPSIQEEFGASPADISAIVAYYGLVYGVALITAGRLGDLYGRRRMFVLGLATFTIASLLCSLAASIPVLIGARMMQGIGAAGMFPQVLSIIRVTAANERDRNRAFAAFGVTLGLSAIAGQLLSGVLVAANPWELTWRSVFLINVPLGIASGFAAMRLIPESRADAPPHLDIVGALLSAAGLGLVLYPLVEGRQAGWPVWMIAATVAAMPVLAIFLLTQHARSRRNDNPLVDPALFEIPAFSSGIAIALLFHSTVIAFPFTLALFLQIGLGYSPLETALILAPLATAFLVAALVAKHLLSKVGSPGAMRLGGVVTLFGYGCCALIALAQQTTYGWALVPGLIAIGFGQGLFLPPLLDAVLASVPKRQAGSASGLVATAQQVGGAFGAAIAGVLYFGSIAKLENAQSHAVGFSVVTACQTVPVLLALYLLSILFQGNSRPASAQDRGEMTT